MLDQLILLTLQAVEAHSLSFLLTKQQIALLLDQLEKRIKLPAPRRIGKNARRSRLSKIELSAHHSPYGEQCSDLYEMLLSFQTHLCSCQGSAKSSLFREWIQHQLNLDSIMNQQWAEAEYIWVNQGILCEQRLVTNQEALPGLGVQMC